MATINSPWRTTSGSNIEHVDPRLRDIMEKAAAELASRHPNYSVEGFSGKKARASGTPNHPKGWAIDANIIGPDGKPIGGERGNVRNGKTWAAYHELAQIASNIQKRDYPELTGRFAWGGDFKQGVQFDQMHFDIGGRRGHYGFIDSPINDAVRKDMARLGYRDVPSTYAWDTTAPASVDVAQEPYQIGDLTANAGPAGQAYADLVKPTAVKTTGAALQPSMPEAKVAANGFAPGLVPASYSEPAAALSAPVSPALSSPYSNALSAPSSSALAPAQQVSATTGFTPQDAANFYASETPAQSPIQHPAQSPVQTTEKVTGTTPNPLDNGLSGWTMGGATPTVASQLGPQSIYDRPAPVDPNYQPAQQAGLLNPTPIASQPAPTPAPALSPPQTIADAPTIAAPQQQPEQQNTFPAAPPIPKDESIFGPRMKGALLGGAVAGLPGAVVGGLLGSDLGGLSGLGGMLGNGPVGPALASERFNAGFGIPGIEAGMYGARGSTGYSRSNPGAFTVSRGPNQGYDLTNQYGVTTPYDAQGHVMGNRQSLSRWGGLLGSMFGGGLLGGDRGGISDKERADFAGRAGLY